MILPAWILIDDWLRSWLQEDIGRGDRTTNGLFAEEVVPGKAHWIVKEDGIVAGLPIAARVFWLLSNQVNFIPTVDEGASCPSGTVIAQIEGPLDALLTGERVALNLVMRLSGVATMTSLYVDKIADLRAHLVDTRKTTPGLRLLEKYAMTIGGAVNHRFGLDDAVMIKDNHIQAAGGIGPAIAQIRKRIPYLLKVEVETSTMAEVAAALNHQADIIMLDNMPVEQMQQAIELIRQQDQNVQIEASGNITLETIRAVAQTGVDYISSSAPITRSPWLDISMRLV